MRGIIAEVRARGDAALFELTAKFDRIDLAKIGLRVSAAEIDAAEQSLRAARRSPRSSSRATASRPITAARSPADDRFTDALGVELGYALERDRGGRALRAGRHRGLSVVGADERRAGQGRRRARGW